MKRVRLSNKEVKTLKETYSQLAPVLEGADVVEVVQISENSALYLVDGEPLLLKATTGELGVFIVPTLYLIHKSQRGRLLPNYPRAVVDPGAVARIVNGADVMRPGIQQFIGDFNKGDVVLVADGKGRVIAISVALYPRAEMEQMQKGKVLLNVHHLGDKIWDLSLKLVKEKP